MRPALLKVGVLEREGRDQVFGFVRDIGQQATT